MQNVTGTRPIVLAFALLVLCLGSGCGLLFQTAFGWHSADIKSKAEHHRVAIESTPSGAQISRKGPGGGFKEIGVAPLADQVEYTVEETTESPNIAGLLLGVAIEGGTAAALLAGVDGAAGKAGAGVLIYFGVQDLLVALIHGAQGASIKGRKTAGGGVEYSYGAKLDGFRDATTLIRVPDIGRADIVMTSLSGVGIPSSGGGARGGGSGGTSNSAWIIAVMDVEDANAGHAGRAIDTGLIRNIGDQLRIFVAQLGARTVDRGAQEKALREQLQSMKGESYKACYDDSCQIELGKALAASHVLRSRVTRFGSRCVLNAELIDLRSEVTVAASSSKGNCEAEGFLTMSENVATNLIK